MNSPANTAVFNLLVVGFGIFWLLTVVSMISGPIC
jgi:hypothetical protein